MFVWSRAQINRIAIEIASKTGTLETGFPDLYSFLQKKYFEKEQPVFALNENNVKVFKLYKSLLN